MSGDSNIINKSVLSSIIQDFDLPISVDEFLKSSGKKEDINFSEFCSLFKSKGNGENLLKSLSSYSSNDKSDNFNPNHGFPIEVRKKNN